MEEKQVNELVIVRTFSAPMEKVWKAWTDPQEAMKWWGPKQYSSPMCQIDFKVGGKTLLAMRGPDGKDLYSTGTYKEIVHHKKIVITDSFADKDGNVVPASYYGMPGEFPMELEVVVLFEEQNGKTIMTLKHIGMPKEMSTDANRGWNESFDKLQKVVEWGK